MKKLILGLAALISAGLTKAQVANYGFTQQTGVYTPITGGTVVATATANTSAGSLDSYNYTFPTGSFPFGFVFNGVSYTGLNINGNGFITFGSTLPTTGLTTPISSATGYNGAVAAFAGDLNSVFNI